MAVLVWRNAFGRTRKRRPRSSSSIASSPRSGHELDERLAGVAPLADDEMAQVPSPFGLVVGGQVLLARPRPHRLPDRVPELGREPATLDVEHLVPAAGLVEAENRPFRAWRERVLELVAVVEALNGGEDRLERRRGN